MRRLNPSLVVGGLIVAVIVLMALLSFVWTPYDATLVDPAGRLALPSWSALVRDRQVRPGRVQPDHGRVADDAVRRSGRGRRRRA